MREIRLDGCEKFGRVVDKIEFFSTITGGGRQTQIPSLFSSTLQLARQVMEKINSCLFLFSLTNVEWSHLFLFVALIEAAAAAAAEKYYY